MILITHKWQDRKTNIFWQRQMKSCSYRKNLLTKNNPSTCSTKGKWSPFLGPQGLYERCCGSVGGSVGQCVVNFLITSSDVARRRQMSYDVARLLRTAPIDPWQNSTPVFGAVAFCMTNIDDFRTSLTSTSSTKSWTYSSQKRSLRWTSLKI